MRAVRAAKPNIGLDRPRVIRSPSLSEFRAYAEAFPLLLPFERLGPDPVLDLMAFAELAHGHQTLEARTALEAGRLARAWQDAIGYLIRWSLTNPRSTNLPSPSARKAVKILRRALDLALGWSSLDTALGSVPLGRTGFESEA